MAPGSGEVRWPRPSTLEWLYLAAGLFLGFRYRWLLDDAFVYFRYVDNWVILGRGPVYNAGEYVEGFTSPVWLFLLSAFRRAGAPFGLTVVVLGALSFVVFWFLLVRVQRLVAPGPGLDLPLAFLAVNYGALCYFTSGVETPLVQVTAACYALFCLRPGSKTLQAALALSPLVRPELALPLAMAVGWCAVVTRRVPWTFVLVGAVLPGSYLAFRVYYYADLLPNTFYLKDTSDFVQGLRYLADTASVYHLGSIMAAATLALALLWRRAHGRPLALGAHAMMVALAVAVTVYVVRIGGDARHYRFLAFPVCLFLCAAGGVVERLLATLPPAVGRPVAIAAALAVSALSGLGHPRQLASHPFWLRNDHARVEKITDAAIHRQRRELDAAAWTTASEVQRQAVPPSLPGGTGAVEVLVDGSCVRAYLNPQARVVHQYGLTDAVLARTVMPADRPAHKRGLEPLARDLARLQEEAGSAAGRGWFRRAAEAGTAPAWMVNNLATLEVVERKIYNRHHPVENLRLALTFPARIIP
jgi:hypothetical protein